MKILFCIDNLSGGGRERRLVQLIKGLYEKEYSEMYILMFSNIIDYDDIKETKCKIIIVDNNRTGYIAKSKQINKIISTIKPDIIHCWSQSFAFYLNILKPFHSFKYIAGFIATSKRFRFFTFERVIEVISFIIADKIVSNSKAGIIAKRTPKRKSIVIYNGFDFNRHAKLRDPKEVRKELNIDSKYIVSMIARVHQQKDTLMFIKVAAHFISIRNDITFLVVGDGPLLDHYKNYARKNKVINIVFTGFIKDVENILNITDVSILCSQPIICPEGVSNTIIESMAAKKPVIATRGGGTNEIIKDGCNGYLVDSNDIESMTKKTVMLLDNPDLREKIGSNAQNDIRERFLLSAMVDKYCNLYHTLKKQ